LEQLTIILNLKYIMKGIQKIEADREARRAKMQQEK
jgi:hypothetical protein